MKWQQLITNKRLGQEERHHQRMDDRSEFKRDYDRLIFSAPFRRLQNKTQVFPLPGSIFVHNRLTHSLEVASLGMSLGNDVASKLTLKHPDLRGTLFEEISTIVGTACLAHDLGNPPFGHSGEKAIQTFFTDGNGQYLHTQINPYMWADFTKFDGNANAFRLLAHRFNGRRSGGFAMTYSMLASIVKYPHLAFHSDKKKFGFFHSEREDYVKIASELGIPMLHTTDGKEKWARHPLVYLVEAADDICYEIMDIEDAHKLHILSEEETISLLLSFFDSNQKEHIWQRIKEEDITDSNEIIAYMRTCVIGLLEHECAEVFVNNEELILEGKFQGSLIKHINTLPQNAYQHCVEVSTEKIYNSRPVLDVELSGYKIIETLLEAMIEAAVNPDRFYSKQLIQRVSSQYDIHSPQLETRLMAVIDYITGMTDVYALDIYQKINGTALPVI